MQLPVQFDELPIWHENFLFGNVNICFHEEIRATDLMTINICAGSAKYDRIYTIPAAIKD